jgi:hypothetical protein
MQEIYGAAAPIYESLGWCVAPAQNQSESKKPVHKGIFGRKGSITSQQMSDWARDFSFRNCLLRLEAGVIGIDIDDYWKGGLRKRGFETISRWSQGLGPLPPTYSSTSRGPNQHSRILFYRLSQDTELISILESGGDVEVIQHHHRYAVVWPSIHPETGDQYQWYGPDGDFSPPPKPNQLAMLPASWETALRKKKRMSPITQEGFQGNVEEWAASFSDEDASELVEEFLEEFENRPRLHVGHDELLRWIGKAHKLQFKYRQPGARQVLDKVVSTYLATTRDPNPEVELVNIIRWIINQDQEAI